MSMITTPVHAIPHTQLGRHSLQDEIAQDCEALFWNGSGVELSFAGEQLTLILNAHFTIFEPWISIDIDGSQVIRQPLHEGVNFVPVVRDNPQKSILRIRLLTEAQFMHEDPTQYVMLSAVEHSGTASSDFQALPTHPYRFEFIGDSITSGQGLIGAQTLSSYHSWIFSTWNSYSRILSDRFNAEFRIISQSGWGILSNCENDPNCTIPKIYDQVCAPATGDNLKLGSFHPFDFDWPDGSQTDLVVINLGTNDNSALDFPEWKSPDGTKRFKLSHSDDYHLSDTSKRLLQSEISHFLSQVRQHNPQAWILWAYGMLGNRLEPDISEAVEKYALDDRKVHYITLPECTADKFGSTSHPGKRSHEEVAQLLETYIRDNCLLE